MDAVFNARIAIRLGMGAVALSLALSPAAARAQAPWPSFLHELKSMQPHTLPQTADPAEVVKSRIVYQSQRIAKCSSGSCQAAFATLGTKQRLELQSIACFIEVDSGQVTGASVSFQASPGHPFLLFLKVDSPLKDGIHAAYTFGQQTGLFVPAGKTLVMFVGYTGSAPNGALCDIFGQMVTLQ
jgi:hypothetical protein